VAGVSVQLLILSGSAANEHTNGAREGMAGGRELNSTELTAGSANTIRPHSLCFFVRAERKDRMRQENTLCLIVHTGTKSSA